MGMAQKFMVMVMKFTVPYSTETYPKKITKLMCKFGKGHTEVVQGAERALAETSAIHCSA